MMIAVTFALPAESSEFVRHLHKKSSSDRNGVRVSRGEIDKRAIEVLHTGVGERVCRQRISSFLRDRQFSCLISAGFAGALNVNQLHVGDLLLAKNFSTLELTGVRSALSPLSIHTGDLLTVPAMIDSNEERQAIARTTDAVAADMETEFIARACAEHGIPLLSLRAISDTPAEPFPAPSNILFDLKRQRTHAMNLSLHLLKHPSAVPRLVFFARRIARAREILTSALVDVIRAIG